MVPRESIKHRAVMMGVATGDMPDVDVIWATQRLEGEKECFGQAIGCSDKGCKWRRHCAALDFYADVRLPVVAAAAVKREQMRIGQDSQEEEVDGFVDRECATAGTLEPVPTVSGAS